MQLRFTVPASLAGIRLDGFLQKQGVSSTLRRALKRQPAPCI